jgi:hypothetical protein
VKPFSWYLPFVVGRKKKEERREAKDTEITFASPLSSLAFSAILSQIDKDFYNSANELSRLGNNIYNFC